MGIVLYPVAGLEIPPGSKYTKLLWKPERFSSELFTESFQDGHIQEDQRCFALLCAKVSQSNISFKGSFDQLHLGEFGFKGQWMVVTSQIRIHVTFLCYMLDTCSHLPQPLSSMLVSVIEDCWLTPSAERDFLHRSCGQRHPGLWYRTAARSTFSQLASEAGQ